MGDLVLALVGLILLNGPHPEYFAYWVVGPAVAFLIGLGFVFFGIIRRSKRLGWRLPFTVGAILILLGIVGIIITTIVAINVGGYWGSFNR